MGISLMANKCEHTAKLPLILKSRNLPLHDQHRNLTSEHVTTRSNLHVAYPNWMKLMICIYSSRYGYFWCWTFKINVSNGCTFIMIMLWMFSYWYHLKWYMYLNLLHSITFIKALAITDGSRGGKQIYMTLFALINMDSKGS